jgi:hypothetical protein
MDCVDVQVEKLWDSLDKLGWHGPAFQKEGEGNGVST